MSVWDRLTQAREPAVERIVQTVREQSFAGLVGEADVGKSALLGRPSLACQMSSRS